MIPLTPKEEKADRIARVTIKRMGGCVTAFKTEPQHAERLIGSETDVVYGYRTSLNFVVTREASNEEWELQKRIIKENSPLFIPPSEPTTKAFMVVKDAKTIE